MQYVQNGEDAQEITQDVFLAVYQSLSSFNFEAKISTWIYRIAINKSVDFLKAKKRKKRFAFITSLFFEDNNEIKHDKQVFEHQGVALEQQESLAKLFKLINDLPEKQKTILILMKIEDKSQAETAEIMNLSVKAVESLFQRAKNNLAKKIKEK